MSRARTRTAVAALCALALVPAVPVAGATTSRSCKSTDLRYPFSPGGPRTFGVFRLTVANGTCATAHRVAKAWMHRFELAFRAGHIALPREVSGFTFKTSPAHVPQTYLARGRRGTTTIRFEYRIPNG